MKLNPEIKFTWFSAFALAIPIGLVGTMTHTSKGQMMPVIVLAAILVAVMRLRKFNE